MQAKGIVLITGASSGFGKATAEQLVQRGYLVIGTSRNAAFPEIMERNIVNMIPMDVRDDGSVEAAIKFIADRAGDVDVLVNNAGYGIAGAVEETSMKEASDQMETNFLGMHRVIRAVLPQMRRKSQGIIINTSSIAGRVGIPFQAFYSASKFAVEGYSEALKMEIAPFNIRVYALEPGDFSTGFTSSRVITVEAKDSDIYQPAMRNAIAVMEHDELHGADPSLIAKTIVKLIERSPARLRFPVGPIFERALLIAKSFLPHRWIEFALRIYYKLGK